MASGPLKRRATALFAVTLLSLSLLGSLILMSGAMQNSARFGALFSILLITNSVGLLAFIFLIGINVRRLAYQLRTRQPGARLTLRMLTFFVVLAVAPVTVLYGLSLDYLWRGIDSWFDARIDRALEDSLQLGREALDVRMRQLLGQTERMADELAQGSPERTRLSLDALRNPDSIVVASAWVPGPAQIDLMRDRSGAEELTLFSHDGELLASSSRITELLPHLPPDPVLAQVRQGQSYIGLDPIRHGDLAVRVAVPVNVSQGTQGRRILHALYPFSSRVNQLAASVEAAYAKYHELDYLREKLKLSFVMSLTLVLLFSIVTSVWAAFYSARRLAAPIRDLAEGTAAVAAGDYTTSLPVASNDEIGFLVRSFNDMTRRIAQARREVETQHEYLHNVLRQLSSGVVTLDNAAVVTTINDAALELLEIATADAEHHGLLDLCARHEHLAPLGEVLAPLIAERTPHWQSQVTMLGSDGRRELMCRGSTLDLAGSGGYVIVVEDVTAIIKGQRDAAWSEVARRLAHEIKNPLTPIQLAAERLRLKYLKKLPEGETEVLERLTNTIIQQVETMKTMVNSFSDYAKTPTVNKGAVDLNQLIGDTLELFRAAHADACIECRFDPALPPLSADGARLRQVFNNLVKNALEASPADQKAHIIVSTAKVHHAMAEHAEVRIEDHGGGVPDELIPNIFDPYVTNKPRGTGLGLAIVKKIVEEHNGVVTLRNRPSGGAVVVIRLPIDTDHAAGQRARVEGTA
ncbi:MAG: ATP-binding protein [Gammaproteobacteria bacterium]